MRGKLDGEEYELAEDRITPAYAGKTWSVIMLVLAQKHHPRVCGENAIPQLIQAGITGSPPRMRGKLWAVYARTI